MFEYIRISLSLALQETHNLATNSSSIANAIKLQHQPTAVPIDIA